MQINRACSNEKLLISKRQGSNYYWPSYRVLGYLYLRKNGYVPAFPGRFQSNSLYYGNSIIGLVWFEEPFITPYQGRTPYDERFNFKLPGKFFSKSK